MPHRRMSYYIIISLWLGGPSVVCQTNLEEQAWGKFATNVVLTLVLLVLLMLLARVDYKRGRIKNSDHAE